MEIKSRLDLNQLFWEVDEFCQQFETMCSQTLLLTDGKPARPYRSRLGLSDVMTSNSSIDSEPVGSST